LACFAIADHTMELIFESVHPRRVSVLYCAVQATARAADAFDRPGSAFTVSRTSVLPDVG
jgi:hypothetical protein